MELASDEQLSSFMTPIVFQSSQHVTARTTNNFNFFAQFPPSFQSIFNEVSSLNRERTPEKREEVNLDEKLKLEQKAKEANGLHNYFQHCQELNEEEVEEIYFMHDQNSAFKMKMFQSLEENKSFILKRRLLILAFVSRLFFMGVQYSVILPTCMLYMKQLGASEVFAGLVISAYPFASMLSAVGTGYVYNKTLRCKEILLVLNVFQLIGNIIYALPYSPWLPLLGRFVCGLGDSFAVVAVGEICDIYPKSHRTGIISLVEFGRVFGFIIGPCLHMVIKQRKYMLGGIIFDATTFPALAMTCFWTVMQLITLFWVANMAKSMRDNPELSKERDNEFSLSNDFENDRTESIKSKENITEDSKSSINEKAARAKTKKKRRLPPSLMKELSLFCTSNIFVIFYIDTVLWMSQSVFEVLLPLITEFEYGWTPSMTGIVYMVGGIELIGIFAYLYHVSKGSTFRDTYLLLASLLLTAISLSLLIFEAIMPKTKQRLGIFFTICALMFAAVPLNLSAVKSLLSKITRPEFRNLTQGLYASVCSFSLIVGPTLGSLVYKNRTEYGGVATVLTVSGIIALCLAMESIHDREDQITIETENKEFLKDLANKS